MRKHRGRCGKYTRSCLADCLSRAKNILKHRVLYVTSSLNVIVPNSCHDCCINMWTSGASIVEKLFWSRQTRIELEPRTTARPNLENMKIESLVDWMLFNSQILPVEERLRPCFSNASRHRHQYRSGSLRDAT